MEGNESSRSVGDKDAMLVHIHVNLSSFEVSRELTNRLVSFVFIHLLDLLLLDSKVEVSTLVFDHQLLYELFVDQALIFLSLLNVSEVSYLSSSLGTELASSSKKLLGLVETILNDFIAASRKVGLLRLLLFTFRLFLLLFFLFRLLFLSRSSLFGRGFLGLLFFCVIIEYIRDFREFLLDVFSHLKDFSIIFD
jgi:hypothetical protein